MRIDDTWLSFVPGELTVHAGWAVRERIENLVKAKEKNPQRYVIAGLANAYIQYLTTRSEYNRQYYEGASTLYGPQSAEYVAERFEILARSMLGQDADKWLAKGQPPIDAIVNFPLNLRPIANDCRDRPDLNSRKSVGGVHWTYAASSSRRNTIPFASNGATGDRASDAQQPGWGTLGGAIRADTQEVLPSCVVRGNGFDCDPIAAIDNLGLDFKRECEVAIATATFGPHCSDRTLANGTISNR